MKLNVGCGRNIMEGWVNIDGFKAPGLDYVVELDDRCKINIPLDDNSVDEFLLSHVIEHIRYPLPLMQELWRIAKPNAICTIRCPYGSSNDADEDPTHVRRMYQGSFGYFSQPYYWRADYGYRGDWQPQMVQLIPTSRGRSLSLYERWAALESERNIVEEMVATLTAVKPLRAPDRELRQWPAVTI